MKVQELVTEKWSAKYKRSINCSNPKGFSQRAHCAGRKKNEDVNEAGSSDRPDEQTKVMSLNDLQKHIGLPKMKLIGRHPEYMKNFYSAQSVGIPVGGRFSRHNGFETVDIAHGPMGDRNFRRMLTFHFSLGGKKISSVDVYQNWDNEKHSNGSILWRHIKTIEHPVDRRANARMARDMEKNMPKPETDA